jgi:hypothetical protein
MKRPSIGKRAIASAQEALEMARKDATFSEYKLKEIERLVEKILDQLIEVQATIKLFEDPDRWVKAMKNRGIAQGSMFSRYMQKWIVSASMQSLCKLWDPTKYPSAVSISNLRKQLTDDVMDRIRDNSIDRLRSAYAEYPSFFDENSKKILQLHGKIRENVDVLYEYYRGSNLKETRDKWIAHSDHDFETASVDHALDELIPFFNETKECFEDINHFVRDASFSWTSVITPLSRDIDLFLTTP